MNSKIRSSVLEMPFEGSTSPASTFAVQHYMLLGCSTWSKSEFSILTLRKVVPKLVNCVTASPLAVAYGVPANVTSYASS
eukprot:jgi/Botrbrau1/10615/Bobra.154_1s0006.1